MEIVYKFSKVTVCQTATDASGDYRIKWHSMSITKVGSFQPQDQLSRELARILRNLGCTLNKF